MARLAGDAGRSASDPHPDGADPLHGRSAAPRRCHFVDMGVRDDHERRRPGLHASGDSGNLRSSTRRDVHRHHARSVGGRFIFRIGSARGLAAADDAAGRARRRAVPVRRPARRRRLYGSLVEPLAALAPRSAPMDSPHRPRTLDSSPPRLSGDHLHLEPGRLLGVFTGGTLFFAERSLRPTISTIPLGPLTHYRCRSGRATSASILTAGPGLSADPARRQTPPRSTGPDAHSHQLPVERRGYHVDASTLRIADNSTVTTVHFSKAVE